MTAVRSLCAAIAIAIAAVAVTAAPAMAAGAPRQFYGVQPLGTPSPDQVSRIAAGGVGSVHLPVSWREVQGSPGAPYNWSVIDTYVGRMTAAGIEVLPQLYETLDALGGRRTLPVHNDAQRQAWAAFVDTIVRRYGPGGQFWAEHGPGSASPLTPAPIRIWEVWNEENTSYFTDNSSPGEYAALLRATNATIKAVDPGAKVIIGGLLGRPSSGTKFVGAMSAQKFLDKLYGFKGIKASFDGVGAHTYLKHAKLVLPTLRELRQVMGEHRDKKTPLYLTEIGWGSGTGSSFGKGPKGQAKELTKAFKMLAKNRKRLKLQRVYWFTLSDGEASLCRICELTGLFTATFEPKPSWYAFARVAGGTP